MQFDADFHFAMFTKKGNKIIYKFCQEAIKNKYTWFQICDKLGELSEPGIDECTDTAVRESIYEFCSAFYTIEEGTIEDE